MTKRIRPTVKLYPVIARAVEEGVGYGIRRAFKYTDESDSMTRQSVYTASLEEHIVHEVMNALCEVLEFDND